MKTEKAKLLLVDDEPFDIRYAFEDEQENSTG